MTTNKKKYSGLNLLQRPKMKEWLNGKLKKLKKGKRDNMNKIKIRVENNKIQPKMKKVILKSLK